MLSESNLDLYGNKLDTIQRKMTTTISKSFWTKIFGEELVLQDKRGYDSLGNSQRWKRYNKDLTIVNVTSASLLAMSTVILPILSEYQAYEADVEAATSAAINKVPGPKLPPPYDVKKEFEIRYSKLYLKEFSKQISILSIRKVFEKVIILTCPEKVADKFCREFYSKLRRTIQRYSYSMITYSKIFKATTCISLTENLPTLIYDFGVESGSFMYKYFWGEANFVDIDYEDVLDYCSKKLMLLGYYITRDSLIRMVLVSLTAICNSHSILNMGMKLEIPNELAYLGLQMGYHYILRNRIYF